MEDMLLQESSKSDKKEFKKYVVNLWFHMLKWDHQRHIQTPSWSDTINKIAGNIYKNYNIKNIRDDYEDNIDNLYNEAVNTVISAAKKNSEYFTSKISSTIPNEYKLNYILDDKNREKWIHSRCGNPLLKSSGKFKYDIIKETDVRIDPRSALK